MIRRRTESGDTIIEVMLAMSIIGMVLGAAFGIANRSVNLGQDAQERTEALKIIESQIEVFKTEYAKEANQTLRDRIQPFCFQSFSTTVANVDDSACIGKNSLGDEGLYSISITPPSLAPGSASSYEFRVVWDPIGGSSQKNTASVFYKPGSL
jgi:type II secretory pathway pseudopilin PulG